MTFLIGSGVTYAESEVGVEHNVKLNQILTAYASTNEEQAIEYFKQILSDGGLFAFLFALNTEVPKISQSVEYVALYKKLDATNQVLSQILVELKKNNQLLSQKE